MIRVQLMPATTRMTHFIRCAKTESEQRAARGALLQITRHVLDYDTLMIEHEFFKFVEREVID